MNKTTLQGLAAGLIIATSIFTGYYYFWDEQEQEPEQPVLTTKQAKAFLENEGYTVTKMAVKKLEEEKKEEKEKPSKSKTEKKKDSVVRYTLRITYKTSASEVAQELEKAKIIDDAVKFQSYLREHDLTGKIQVAEYKLKSSMSNEEIAEMITTN